MEYFVLDTHQYVNQKVGTARYWRRELSSTLRVVDAAIAVMTTGPNDPARSSHLCCTLPH
jgi:hypothetical protein